MLAEIWLWWQAVRLRLENKNWLKNWSCLCLWGRRCTPRITLSTWAQYRTLLVFALHIYPIPFPYIIKKLHIYITLISDCSIFKISWTFFSLSSLHTSLRFLVENLSVWNVSYFYYFFLIFAYNVEKIILTTTLEHDYVYGIVLP